MTKPQKKANKKRRRDFSVLIVIIILLFVKASYDYSQKNNSSTAEAVDVSESLLLMSEGSAVNMAFEQEKYAIEVEKAQIVQENKKREILDHQQSKKIAYLTFDDGPSSNITPQVLDVLKEYNVKATFFVIGNMAERYPDIIKRMNKEGHSIGNHSYSHSYKYIYGKTSNFINELKRTEKVLNNILGEKYETNVIRFPGGSFGSKKAPFRKAVKDKGYVYYDWNSLNGDAEGHNISKRRLVQRFKTTFNGQKKLTILMHDMETKQTTVDALPEIIEFLQEQGYEFSVLK